MPIILHVHKEYLKVKSQADTTKAKVVIWANFDKHFFRQLSDNCISRKLRIKIEFSSINEFFDRCGHKHNIKNQLTFFHEQT